MAGSPIKGGANMAAWCMAAAAWGAGLRGWECREGMPDPGGNVELLGVECSECSPKFGVNGL